MSESADIVWECAEGEDCLALVPSGRLTAEAFLAVLEDNGIAARTLAQGVGTVQDGTGRLFKVAGVILVALNAEQIHAVEKVARLCGIATGKIL